MPVSWWVRLEQRTPTGLASNATFHYLAVEGKHHVPCYDSAVPSHPNHNALRL
jgi:hypothetical protein